MEKFENVNDLEQKRNIDPTSSLEIRSTDNGLKECDLEAPQTATLLELDERGLPKGWEAPNGDR